MRKSRLECSVQRHLIEHLVSGSTARMETAARMARPRAAGLGERCETRAMKGKH
jgi:hypothetical protein